MKKLPYGTQKKIADKANCKTPRLSQYINVNTTGKRPQWAMAKTLANVIGATPELWLEGSTKEIKAAIAKVADTL